MTLIVIIPQSACILPDVLPVHPFTIQLATS